MPARPQKTRFCSAVSPLPETRRQHSANTRMASCAISSLRCRMRWRSDWVRGAAAPFFSTKAQRCSKMSGAPLVNISSSPPLERTMTDIILRWESKGSSRRRVYPLVERSTPPLTAITARAASVGSPSTA